MALTTLEKLHIDTGCALAGLGARIQAELISGVVAAGSISTVELADLAVTTGKVAANAITLAKMVQTTLGSMLIGTAGDMAELDVSTDTGIIVGNGTTAAVQTLGGDVSMDNVGDVTIAATAVETGMIALDAIDNTLLADDSVSLEQLDSGIAPSFICVGAVANDTMSREENVDGLSSAITLCNSLLTVMNTHAADGAGALHVAADATNFPVAGTASDLASLLVQTGLLLTAYDVHDDDSELGAAWLYHDAQEAGDHSLVSAVTPTTLVEAVTRLNDLKAKYNAHDADATTHTSGSNANQEATVDADYGVANLVPEANALPSDVVVWSILEDGTGTVSGVSAVAGTAGITFTFDADPQDDAIISYSVFRAVV